MSSPLGLATCHTQLSARAAANRRVVEADVAAATAFTALLQAVAASLNHRAAFLVAARAADAAAVLRVFTLALAAAEVDLAALNAVPSAAAAAEAVAEHAAEVLQRATGDFIVATAVNLAAGGGLFEFDRAARQHAPVGVRRRADWKGTRLPLHGARERRDRRRTAFQQLRRCHDADSFRLAIKRTDSQQEA